MNRSPRQERLTSAYSYSVDSLAGDTAGGVAALRFAALAELTGTVDDEAVHVVEQVAGELEHLFGCGGKLRGTRSGLLHQFAHLVHGADDGLRAGSLFFDGRVDFLGDFRQPVRGLGDLRGADRLLVGGGADFLGELVNFGHHVGDFVQRGTQVIAETEPFFHDARAVLHVFNGLARFTLDALNQVGNFLGGLGGFFRQFTDFVGDNGEAQAVFAGAGCFDGRVERKQVGLFREVVDHFDDLADVVGAMAEDVDDFR